MTQMRASHILVDNEDDAKALIERIQKGEAFSEIAMEFSTCPSKRNGGDLGMFEEGMMVKPFEEAVLKLKIGEMSPIPVKTQFGYHIIKRTG